MYTYIHTYIFIYLYFYLHLRFLKCIYRYVGNHKQIMAYPNRSKKSASSRTGVFTKVASKVSKSQRNWKRCLCPRLFSHELHQMQCSIH